jgi:hypothetical protein
MIDLVLARRDCEFGLVQRALDKVMDRGLRIALLQEMA